GPGGPHRITRPHYRFIGGLPPPTNAGAGTGGSQLFGGAEYTDLTKAATSGSDKCTATSASEIIPTSCRFSITGRRRILWSASSWITSDSSASASTHTGVPSASSLAVTVLGSPPWA